MHIDVMSDWSFQLAWTHASASSALGAWLSFSYLVKVTAKCSETIGYLRSGVALAASGTQVLAQVS